MTRWAIGRSRITRSRGFSSGLAQRVGVGGFDAARIAGHSTRIEAEHDLVEAGFDVAAIANAGGWKSLMMPNYYTRELRVKQSAMAQMIGRRGK